MLRVAGYPIGPVLASLPRPAVNHRPGRQSARPSPRSRLSPGPDLGAGDGTRPWRRRGRARQPAACRSTGVAGAGAGHAAWRLKLAIHYLPPVTNHSQYDVVLAGTGQTWFLGGSDVGGHGKPEIERIKNGVPHSAPLPTGPHSWITAASAPSPADIWAVTYLGGSVLNWNGATWRAEPRGGWKAGTRFTGITATSAADVWVFGTSGRRYPGAGTWHFNGSTWTRVNGAAAGIFQASAAGAGDLWGIGNAGAAGNALLHFGGSAWRRVRPSALAGFTLLPRARVVAVRCLGRGLGSGPSEARSFRRPRLDGADHAGADGGDRDVPRRPRRPVGDRQLGPEPVCRARPLGQRDLDEGRRELECRRRGRWPAAWFPEPRVPGGRARRPLRSAAPPPRTATADASRRLDRAVVLARAAG